MTIIDRCRSLRLLAAAVVLVATVGCATRAPHPEDPLESVNRATWGFQTHVLDNVLDPVAEGYRAVVPERGREGVRNALDNLERPTAFLNHLLQGEPCEALATTGAFVIDTVIGLLGLFRPAERMGLADRYTGFGDTLTAWGVGQGVYLVVPPLGGGDARAVTGRIVDTVTNPTRWVLGDTARIAVTATRVVDTSERTLDRRHEVLETADDPYAAFRARHVIRAEDVRREREPRDAASAPPGR